MIGKCKIELYDSTGQAHLRLHHEGIHNQSKRMQGTLKAPGTKTIGHIRCLAAYPQNVEDHHTDGAMNHLEAKAHPAL